MLCPNFSAYPKPKVAPCALLFSWASDQKFIIYQKNWQSHFYFIKGKTQQKNFFLSFVFLEFWVSWVLGFLNFGFLGFLSFGYLGFLNFGLRIFHSYFFYIKKGNYGSISTLFDIKKIFICTGKTSILPFSIDIHSYLIFSLSIEI